MRKTRIHGVALVAVAGLACPAIWAQTGDSQQTTGARRDRVRRVSPVPLQDGGLVTPTEVRVNGVSVPFWQEDGGTDNHVIVYDNMAPPNGTLFAPAATNQRALDDVSFTGGPGAGAGRQITGVRFGIGTVATPANPTAAVTVEFEFYNTLNPAVTPVNSGSTGTIVQFTIAAPTGGWLGGQSYSFAGFTVIGTPFFTMADNGALDVRFRRDHARILHL